MTSFLKMSAAALAMIACGLLGGQAAMARSAAPAGAVPPPLSRSSVEYFRAHPQAWSKFVAKLPRRQNTPVPTVKRFVAAVGGTWTPLKNVPSFVVFNNEGFCSPHVLHNGTVIIQVCDTGIWYRWRPTFKGNYINGTWKQIASMPVIGGVQYAPRYYASAMLPDGRFLVVGGEYNQGILQFAPNLGAIYDPVADTWTAVGTPVQTFPGMIGDAQSVLLANGTFVLGPCCDSPGTDWLLNPDLSWTPTGAPAAGGGFQDEEGYELLPSGKVLAIDIHVGAGNATTAEEYDPIAGTWGDGGTMPVSLPDPQACGYGEIGPAVVRPNGTLVAFGGHTNRIQSNNGTPGCDPNPDPTAILHFGTGVWTQGPNIPSVCGSGSDFCSLADAPAAILPDGNVLFAASSGVNESPTHFFELALAGNAISQVADAHFASIRAAYQYNFVVLPTGQVLATDTGASPEIYTPAGAANAAAVPTIISVPSTVTRTHAYFIKGKQMSGRSAGAYYGDDFQSATNFPVVRVVSQATGQVSYATTNHCGNSSIRAGALSSCIFKVPFGAATGASTLYVVANGIASAGAPITVN